MNFVVEWVEDRHGADLRTVEADIDCVYAGFLQQPLTNLQHLLGVQIEARLIALANRDRFPQGWVALDRDLMLAWGQAKGPDQGFLQHAVVLVSARQEGKRGVKGIVHLRNDSAD